MILSGIELTMYIHSRFSSPRFPGIAAPVVGLCIALLFPIPSMGQAAETALPAATAAPATPQAVTVPVAPVEMDTGAPVEKPLELQQVEAALGGDMSRPYRRFQLMFPSGASFSFARFLYDEYTARRHSGIILAGIVAPILAVLTTLGVVSIWVHAKSDGGGYCPHDEHAEEDDSGYGDTGYDDYGYYGEDGDYGGTRDDTSSCGDEDLGEFVGMIVLGGIGGTATLATLLPGIGKIGKNSKRRRLLHPLVVPKSVSGPRLQLFYNLGPRLSSVGFYF